MTEKDFLPGWAKGLPDLSAGWRCDDVKKLKARYDGLTTGEFEAELRYEKVFGFAPRRLRITVRCQLPLHDREKEWPPRAGITLIAGDEPFGKEGAWRMVGVVPDESRASAVELFLEE